MAGSADIADDYLAHYGVLGMKWGRHRSKSSTATSGPKPRASADASKANAAKAKAKSKGLDSLSNKELQDMVTRMNLEQQYSKLSPTASSKGAQFTKDLLKKTGKDVASEMTKAYLKKGLEAGIKLAVSAAMSK